MAKRKSRKVTALLLLSCLLSTAVAVPGALATDPVPTPIALTNLQVDKATGNVTVTATGAAGEPVVFTWTPSPPGPSPVTGVIGTPVTFNAVQKGNYTLRAEYNSVTVPPPVGSTTINVSVPDPSDVKPITISSATGGVNKVTVTGTAEPGRTVILYFDGATQAAGPVAVSSSGNYSLEWIGPGSIAGTYSVSVGPGAGYPTAQTAGKQVTVSAIKDLVITDVRLAGRDSLRVTGTGTANATVNLTAVFNGGGLGKTIPITLDSKGNFNVLITGLAVGTYERVDAAYYGESQNYPSNPAGFVYLKTASFNTGGPWEVKAASPDDIEITKVTPGVGSIVVEGKAKAGATVKVSVSGSGGSGSGTQTVGSNKTFKVTITLAAGTYSNVVAEYTDPTIVGSGGAASGTYVVTDGTSSGTYPTLYRGISSSYKSYVTALQEYLKSLGYYTIKVDGIFGVGTETAVRNFQIMNGISPANGIADDATQKLLYSGLGIGIGGSGGGGGGSSGGYTTLRFGSSGTAVRTMQTRLANLGYYYGAIDGIFGSQTEAAVRSFQARNNLAVDGVAGSKTQTAIFSSSALSSGNTSSGYVYLHYGSKGQAVIRLQTALKNLGYYKGVLDGQYFDQTYAAVKAFQRAKGLVADGIAGKKTQNALYGTNY